MHNLVLPIDRNDNIGLADNDEATITDEISAGIEANIKGGTHALAQRRQERTVPAPAGRAKEELEDGSKVASEDEDREREEAAVGGVGELPAPPGRKQTTKEGEGRPSNEIRTTMEEIDVGEDKMDEGGVKEAEGDEA